MYMLQRSSGNSFSSVQLEKEGATGLNATCEASEGAQAEADDTVTGSVLFEQGVALSGNWCFNADFKDFKDECTILGTEGSIRFPFFGPQVTVVLKKKGVEEKRDFTNPVNIQQPHIQNVVQHFRGEGPNPCSIDDAIVVMKIIDSFTKKM